MVKIKTTEQEEKGIEAMIDSTKLEKVVFLPQSEREIEDVWFVLLDVINRESLLVPPGMALLVITGVFYNLWHECSYSPRLLCLTVVSMAEHPEVYPAESISVSTPRVSSKMEVVEEIVVQEEDKMLPKSAVQEVKQPFRERSDDWFLSLDVVAKETVYVSPGTNCPQISLL